MKQKLISYFKLILGITELEENERKLQDQIRRLREEFDVFREATGVGVDVSIQESKMSPSWAVICINGSKDYVRFVELPAGEIREVGKFLRQFERSRYAIDCPPNMPKAFITQR